MSIFGVGRCGKSLKASPIPQMVWSALLQRPVTLTVLDLRACVNGFVVIPHAVGLLISPQKENSHLQKTPRSEEHTSELQSRGHIVCRLLLEKKKKHKHNYN